MRGLIKDDKRDSEVGQERIQPNHVRTRTKHDVERCLVLIHIRMAIYDSGITRSNSKATFKRISGMSRSSKVDSY